jgi:Domain of Unknown Function (DUF1259)
MDLAFLFISAFAASTILPMSSEVVLSALALAGATEVWLLLAVATAGNTLGAVVNWGIGRYAATCRARLPVYHFTVARADEVTEAGMAIPPAMGTATAINFQPTGDGKAAITGDFVMTGNEVNPVIRALQEQGIQVSALEHAG